MSKKKQTIETVETEQSYAVEMVAAGDAMLTELHSIVAELERNIVHAGADLEQEIAGQAARAEQRTRALDQVQAATAAHNEATGYALLTGGKPHEKAAIARVAETKQALEQARTRQDKIERETAEQDAASLARVDALHERVRSASLEIETRRAEIEAVDAGRAKAHREAGIACLAELKSAWPTLCATVDEWKQGLVHAQAEQYATYETAVRDLAPWPDLQREALRLLPWHDSTTALLESTIAYASTLLEHAFKADTNFPMSWPFWDTVTIPTQQVRDFHELLRERRDHIAQLLRDYQAFKINS
jgi:hypothetical protein